MAFVRSPLTLIMSTRSPYNGSYRKLVLAFDIGTTYSGISYSILDPGQVPEIKGVTRFPSQERVGGDSKIPTIMYYDQDGQVRAVGAEAMREGLLETAEDENWTKAEWFKLHLRPNTTSSSSVTEKIPPLPRDKYVIDLFADFMRYLYNCAKTFIQETHASGADLWASVEDHIEYVLTHPNGWEGAQQGKMRTAAILAGMIPDTNEGRARVQFVTEGEASLHFCIQSGLTAQGMKNGDGVLIVDAGGGTIDISAYGQTSPSSFEEIASPQCHFQGSVFVTDRARAHVATLLRDSKFADDIDNITNSFDKTTKLTFRNVAEPQFVKFGSVRDRDLKLNIRSGQLKLLGPDVAAFFQPSLSCIVQAVRDQQATAKKIISSVFLVGGFAASDWLFSQLKDTFEPLGLKFNRPDSHVNKAVADGAVSFFLDHFVGVRVSKHDYGIGIGIPFEPNNDEHRRRESQSFISLSGEKRLNGYFDIILAKNTQVSETREFRRSYSQDSTDPSYFYNTSVTLQCYRGQGTPGWLDVDPSMYSTLCIVEADVSRLSSSLTPRRKAGRRYYILNFDVVLSFGLTELKAQICWKERGEEKRSPARIVYDAEVVINDGDSLKDG